jgi:hypothetical protein
MGDGVMKRDANDIAREEGVDALRAAFDRAAPLETGSSSKSAPKSNGAAKRDADDILREEGPTSACG